MVSPRSVFMGGVRKEEEEKMYDAIIDNSRFTVKEAGKWGGG